MMREYVRLCILGFNTTKYWVGLKMSMIDKVIHKNEDSSITRRGVLIKKLNTVTSGLYDD